MSYKLYANDLYEGMIVEAKFINTMDEIWCDYFIPVRIEKEYPRWFLCTVLPHRNKGKGFGESIEYSMTIDKHDLSIGEIICRKR